MIEGDVEEVVEVDLLVPLGDLVDVVGHDQVRQGKRPQSLNPCLELTLKLVATHHPDI